MKRFKKICKRTQEGMIPYLVFQLKNNGYTEIIQADGYIYAKGEIPILLTAHMDTVHANKVREIKEEIVKGQHVISSPQGIGGDDRCGIYMILKIIETHKCSILFCEDEEIGTIGSKKFCQSEFINELSELKYLIELDRANANDAVFYDCDNPEFTKFITENTGYTEAHGSYSDISNLAPHCKVAAVNLSCGYYKAHTKNEYVVWEEMLHTIEVVKKLLDVECEQFEYIEAKRSFTSYSYGGYRGYGGYGAYGLYGRYNYYDDDDYYNPYSGGYNSNQYRNSNAYGYNSHRDDYMLSISYMDKDGNLHNANVRESSYNAIWGKFFVDHPDICYNDILDYDFCKL